AKRQYGGLAVAAWASTQQASGGDLDQPFFPQARHELDHIFLALGPGNIECLQEAVTQLRDRTRLFKRLPDLDANPFQTEVKRAIEVQNGDLVVDLARHLTRCFSENSRWFNHGATTWIYDSIVEPNRETIKARGWVRYQPDPSQWSRTYTLIDCKR